MPGVSRRYFGWGIGAVVTAALGFALASTAGQSVRKPAGEKLLAEKEGQILELVVASGTIVDGGLDLVMLDNDKERANLELAQENLQKVADEIRNSGVVVALPDPPLSLGGRIVQTGPLHAPTSVGGGRMPKNVKPLPQVEGTGEAARNLAPKPDAGELAKLQKAANQEFADAKAEEAYLEGEIQNTKLEIEDAQRARETSRIITDRARLDLEQGRRLLLEGAISQNSVLQKDSQLRVQEDILKKNQSRVDDATSKLADLREKLSNAQEKQASAQADLAKAPERATPKIGTVTRVASKSPSIGTPKGPIVRKPAYVVPGNPEQSTAPAKVEIDNAAKRATDDRLKEAENKVKLAEETLLARRITAPRRMKIVRWLVRPSDRIKKGHELAIIEYLPEVKKTESQPEIESSAPVMDKPREPKGEDSQSNESKPLQNEPDISENTR